MRALFIGGVVDNSEMDLDGSQPPVHYPENSGTGRPRYRLHQIGQRDDGTIAYAVYGAPDLADQEVQRFEHWRSQIRHLGLLHEMLLQRGFGSQ
jgi:hypothetical protein